MTAMVCPACRRPVAMARPTCLYCGAPLPVTVVEAALAARQAVLDQVAPVDGQDPVLAPPEARPEPRVEPRVVFALDLSAAEPGAVAAALGVSLYEAGQRCRRSGPQLLRVGPPPTSAEQASLSAAGARWRLLPENDVRTASRPLQALGGTWIQGRLRLRVLRADTLEIAPGTLLMGARATLQRQRETEPSVAHSANGRGAGSSWSLTGRAPAGAWRRGLPTREPGLEPAHRLHLHRRDDPRPIELDPGDFEFGDQVPVPGAPLLALLDWTERLLAGAPLDDGFKWLAPVMAPSNPETGAMGVRAALGQRSASAAARAVRVHDNLEQFRFYSAWRGLFER